MNAPNQGLPPTRTKPDEPSNVSDASLEQRAREVYLAAARGIDPVTAGRLRAARRSALAQPGGSVHGASRWLVPTGAFAVLALTALMMWQPASRPPPRQLPHTAVSEAPADTDNELPPDADKADPSLYQNMDFYGWLASSQSPDSSPTNR